MEFGRSREFSRSRTIDESEYLPDYYDNETSSVGASKSSSLIDLERNLVLRNLNRREAPLKQN